MILPRIFQGTAISDVESILSSHVFHQQSKQGFLGVSDSTWTELECSLYILYQTKFLKGEEV